MEYQLHHDVEVIPVDFIRPRLKLTWKEIHWGYENRLLGWSAPIDFACDKLIAGSDNSLEVELSGLQKSESHQVGDLIRKLAEAEAPQSEDTIKRKWLFLRLSLLFDKRDEISNPLRIVETIYADFNYPPEIQQFVAFMPPIDGYDPSKYTLAENEARLFELWRVFLEREQRLLIEHN